MSSDGTPKAKVNLSSIATIIVAIVIILGALYINFRDPVNRFLFNSANTTLVSEDTGLPAGSSSAIELDMAAAPQGALSPAIQTLDQYYKSINNAQKSDELDKAWNMMTINSKCNPSDRCNFARFQTYWWQSKVQYKLYDCGSNTIDAELIYYARKSAGPSVSAKAERVRYELIDESGKLKMNSKEMIEKIGSDCELAVSTP